MNAPVSSGIEDKDDCVPNPKPGTLLDDRSKQDSKIEKNHRTEVTMVTEELIKRGAINFVIAPQPLETRRNGQKPMG